MGLLKGSSSENCASGHAIGGFLLVIFVGAVRSHFNLLMSSSGEKSFGLLIPHIGDTLPGGGGGNTALYISLGEDFGSNSHPKTSHFVPCSRQDSHGPPVRYKLHLTCRARQTLHALTLFTFTHPRSSLVLAKTGPSHVSRFSNVL